MVFHHSNRKVINTATHKNHFLEFKVPYYPQSHMGCLTSAVNTDSGHTKASVMGRTGSGQEKHGNEDTEVKPC